MEQSLKYSDFKFKPGDYVYAFGEAKILDVLHSKYTEDFCVYIRFARNFGNARKYDILESDKLRSSTEWTKINKKQYSDAIKRRIEGLQKEIE